MLCKIGCNLRHPLYDALPVPYVPVRVTRGALVAHRYTYVPLCCRTSHYRITFIPLSVYLWNDVAHPVFDGVRLTGLKSRTISCSLPFCHLFSLCLFSLSLLSFYSLVSGGLDFLSDMV